MVSLHAVETYLLKLHYYDTLYLITFDVTMTNLAVQCITTKPDCDTGITGFLIIFVFVFKPKILLIK